MKKLSKLFYVALVTLGVFFLSTSVIAKAEEAGNLVDVVDTVKIEKTDNKEDGLRKYDKLLITIEWSDKGNIKAGDYFYVDLPKELYSVNSTFKVMVNEEDSQAEAGVCTVEGSKLKCVFNDYAEEHNNLKGSIFIERLYVGSISESGTRVPLEIIVNGEASHVESMETAEGGIPLEFSSLTKYGYYDENKTLVWNLKVNLNDEEVKNLVIEDYVGKNQIIDKDSIRIFTCKWDENGEIIYESLGDNLINQFKTEIKDNYFKIYIGDTKDNYFVTYNVKVLGYQDEYSNKAVITGDNFEKNEVEVSITALKDYANAAGDNDVLEKADEDEKLDSDDSKEDSFDKEDNKEEKEEALEKDTNESVTADENTENTETKVENTAVKTWDNIHLSYLMMAVLSLTVIVVFKKKVWGV